MSKYSKEAEEFIGEKMHKMAGEDRPQDQKVAIAMSYARKEGFKVPKKLIDREKKKQKNAK